MIGIFLWLRQGEERLGREFNTTGRCYPQRHYMVDMERQLERLEQMVERGEYFASIGGGSMGRLQFCLF